MGELCIKLLLKENLSNVKQEEYEENGKVYYMNGQNGTFFDCTDIETDVIMEEYFNKICT